MFIDLRGWLTSQRQHWKALKYTKKSKKEQKPAGEKINKQHLLQTSRWSNFKKKHDLTKGTPGRRRGKVSASGELQAASVLRNICSTNTQLQSPHCLLFINAEMISPLVGSISKTVHLTTRSAKLVHVQEWGFVKPEGCFLNDLFI